MSLICHAFLPPPASRGTNTRHVSTGRTDQPKRPETSGGRRQGRSGATKNVFWPKLGSHPTDFRFDRCVFFPAACRTRSGGRKYPNRPNTALFTPICFYVGSFSPLIYIYIFQQILTNSNGIRSQQQNDLERAQNEQYEIETDNMLMLYACSSRY